VNDRKHILVGLFVLGGFVLLGTLIIWFEGVSHLIRGGYLVRGHLASAQGIRPGKRVHLDGIEVGDVLEVTSSQPDRPGVWVHMRIRPEVRIPRGAAFVAQQSTVGDIYLDFRSPDHIADYLATDGSAEVDGTIKGPALLPEDLMADFRAAMSKFERLDTILANVAELTEPRTPQDVEAGKRQNLWTFLAEFEETGRTLRRQLKGEDTEAGLGRLLAQAAAAAEDLRKTLEAARKTLAQAQTALARLDQAGKTFSEAGKKADALLTKGDALIAQLGKTADQADALLKNLNGAVADLRAGKGTLGRLLTDDQLHRALVTLIENLHQMTDNADRLITLWRKEGILAKEGD